MQFTLSASQLKAFLCFAPKKELRAYLIGVHVRQDHRGTILEATDGSALAMMRVDDSSKPEASCIIPYDIAKQLSSAKAGKHGEVYYDFQVCGMDVTVKGVSTVLTFQRIDGIYPDTARVVPDYFKGEIDAPAQINPELLVRFQDAAIALGQRRGLIEVHHRGSTNSCLVSIGVDNFIGVVMPWRMEGFAFDTAWIKQSKPQMQPEAVAA